MFGRRSEITGTQSMLREIADARRNIVIAVVKGMQKSVGVTAAVFVTAPLLPAYAAPLAY